MRAPIVLVANDTGSAVGFSYSSEDIWQTSGCVSFRIDLTTLVNGTVTTRPVYPEKVASICFEGLRARKLFLDLAQLEGPSQSTAVYF